MDGLLRWLLELPPPLIYLVSGLVILSETALLPGIVLPTLSTLLLLGFLAEHEVLELWLAVTVAAAAAFLGDQLGYLEGRRWGPRLRSTKTGLRFGAERWDKLDAAVSRYGVPAVMAGRCLAGVRTIVPRLAGSAAMPYGRFAVGSSCAAVGWAVAEILAGATSAAALS